MKYQPNCIFDQLAKCPLFEFDLEIKGNLCEACADVRTLEGLKAALIAELLMNYQAEEKAKEVYDRIGKLVGEW